MALHDKNGQENKRVLTLICLKMVHADSGLVKRLLARSAQFLSQSEQDTLSDSSREASWVPVLLARTLIRGSLVIFKKDLDVWEFPAQQARASFIFYPESNVKSSD